MINGIDYLKKMYPNREEKDYQPSGLDLRVGQVYEIGQGFVAGLINGQKINLPHYPLEKQTWCQYEIYDAWEIKPGIPYIFEVDQQIQIGEHNAQFYLPRSTLLRNGVNVYTALGDLGYNGSLSFLVINHNPTTSFYITEGERFAQLVDFEVQGGSELYDGDYQNDKHK